MVAVLEVRGTEMKLKIKTHDYLPHLISMEIKREEVVQMRIYNQWYNHSEEKTTWEKLDSSVESKKSKVEHVMPRNMHSLIVIAEAQVDMRWE